MTTTTINAAANPDLVNNLVSKATVTEAPKVQPAEITIPLDTLVTLPGGYVNDAGEVIKTVEVRELNGRDEEALSKTNSLGRIFISILNRATVSVGGQKVTEEMLDRMFAGDRDVVLLGIYRATFGNTAEIDTACRSCDEYKSVTVDINTDIAIKPIGDVLTDSSFTVMGKKNEYLVNLPTGIAQKEIYLNSDKATAELTTILLEHCIQEINGNPVLGKAQVQGIGIADRRLIGEELNKRNFGPQFDDIELDCPDCGEKLVVPISFGSLFRF